jgi:hypothetical protein
MQDKIVLKPCSENWDAMTPTEQGRHCAKCDMVVHEVSRMSNDEVMTIWHQNDGAYCINIPQERVIPVYTNRYLRWKYMAATALLTLWLSAKQLIVNAQADTKTKTNEAKDSIISSSRIAGVVVDSIENNTPMAFAYVRVLLPDSSVRGTYTDGEGKFTLFIEKELSTADSFTISCELIGFETASITARIRDTVDAEIFMSQNHICLKEAVIMVEIRQLKGIISGRTYSGVPMDRGEFPVIYRNKLLDDFDTKTYHSDEIERMNLGR